MAIGEELDEPGMEADAVGGGEPDVLVGEAEPSGGEGVGLGEAGEDGDVHELLLERDQQRDPRHHYPPDAVHQHAQVRHHFRRRSPSGIGSSDGSRGGGGARRRRRRWPAGEGEIVAGEEEDGGSGSGRPRPIGLCRRRTQSGFRERENY